MLHHGPHVPVHARKNRQELQIPAPGTVGFCRGIPWGGSQCLHTGNAELSVMSRPAKLLCGRDWGGPVRKLRGSAKHRSRASFARVFANRISAASRLTVPCRGFNFLPREGLILKSKATASRSV